MHDGGPRIVETFHIGHWQGGAYTNDTTGAFSHCAAAASYLNGISLSIGQNANREWLIGFIDPSWNLPEGQSFPIELTFDGQAQLQIFGTPGRQKTYFGNPTESGSKCSAKIPAYGGNQIGRAHV